MEGIPEQIDARRHQKILGQGNGWLSVFINKMNQEKQPPMETAIPVQQSVSNKLIQPLQRMFSLGDTTIKPATTTTSTSDALQQRRLSIPTSICHYNTDEVIEEDTISKNDDDQSVLSEVTLMVRVICTYLMCVSVCISYVHNLCANVCITCVLMYVHIMCTYHMYTVYFYCKCLTSPSLQLKHYIDIQ